MEKQERMTESVEDKKNDQIKKILKHPASLLLIGGVAIVALMYSSKFFFDAAGQMVRAYKRFRAA